MPFLCSGHCWEGKAKVKPSTAQNSYMLAGVTSNTGQLCIRELILVAGPASCNSRYTECPGLGFWGARVAKAL